MKFKKALFISHEKFLNPASSEGGVKFCTAEYIKLIRLNFELIYLPVQFKYSWKYRLKKKIGLSVYDDYEPNNFREEIAKNIDTNEVSFVFLNLTNTSLFSKFIKLRWPHVKIIMCSHGNESGDHLHAISLHNNYKGILKKTAVYSLGNMLVKESYFRKYIDIVLTVSDVEVGIEKWLGAKTVLLVPRIIDANNIKRKPVNGRVGFLADLSHEPNFYGIKEVCDALKKIERNTATIHLVGGGIERGLLLAQQYSFVKYLGYLNENDLIEELITWTFALNPVFYYSRGVSTKLGKVLGVGIPVITTEKGMRGYEWTEGTLPLCETPNEMAGTISKIANDFNSITAYNGEVLKIQSTVPSLNHIADKLMSLLK